MVKSLENGVSLAPFLVKCYEMVNDESTNELISWTESNNSFIIRDESRFSSELLPKYFKHSNFSSFVRQLNIYGFRKIDTDQWEFANEAFIKGQKHLLKNITRRKQPQSLVKRKPSQQKDMNRVLVASEEADRNIALLKEVENLKTDKNALTQELAKLSVHQQSSQSRLVSLREQIKGMEKNQQQMLSFIVMAMQNPEFLLQFLHPKENTAKLSEVTDNDDGMIIRYLPPNDEEEPGPPCNTAASNSEDDLMGLDFSSDEMRDFLVDIDLFFGPMDEKLHSMENHSQFVLPDFPETENDSMLERLLLSSSTETEQCEQDETEDFILFEEQIGSEFQPKESNKSNCSKDEA